MKIKLYQIDAFTDQVFSGNPAAVCPLEGWLDDGTLQHIASENNLAETAYFVKAKDGYHIRWFTPVAEVDLCGHATLAAAYVIFNFSDYASDSISFQSKSGVLTVTRSLEWYTLNFPADKVQAIAITPELIACIGKKPSEAYQGLSDAMLVFSSRQMIEQAIPDFSKIAQLKARGLIITAPGTDTDFVSRFFAPAEGIDEDPATGSAHSMLTPFWSEKLGKNAMQAKQVSQRGGEIWVEQHGDRVIIAGSCVFYMKGRFEI